MAYAMGTWSPEGKLGAVTLEASAAHATNDAVGTAVFIGKGKKRIVTDATVVKVSGNNEMYLITLEANTIAATTTYKTIATLFAGGDTSVTGRDTDDVLDSQEIIIDNPYDYQVRVRSNMVGSSPSITYSVNAYPLGSKD